MSQDLAQAEAELRAQQVRQSEITRREADVAAQERRVTEELRQFQAACEAVMRENVLLPHGHLFAFKAEDVAVGGAGRRK